MRKYVTHGMTGAVPYRTAATGMCVQNARVATIRESTAQHIPHQNRAAKVESLSI